jgi:predicted O-methyltransferase YrrM
MNPVLDEIIKQGFVQTERGETMRLHSEVSMDRGNFLKTIIAQLRPAKTLEVGLAFGISTLYICDALSKTSKTKHIAIDPHQHGNEWKGAGLYNIKRAGYSDIVEFYDLPSHQVLPQLEKEGLKIDFAFIDGRHTFDYALVDFFHIDKILNVGGVVVFDDAHLGGIRKVCRYIATNLSYSVYDLLKQDILRKISLKHMCVDFFLRFVDPGIAHRVFRTELLDRDDKLNLCSTMIAFMKESEDHRIPDYHKYF